MQTRALILFLCTALYLMEFALVPHLMEGSDRAGHETCCRHGACNKTHSEKNAAGVDCCLNCPLSYVTVLALEATPSKTTPLPQEYPIYVSSYVSTYHDFCWKPPNA